MIVLALYTMRKRGLTFTDVLNQGKQQMRRGPPLPPSYGQDQKQHIDDEYVYRSNASINAPQPAAMNTRSGSLSSKTRLQTLGPSDSFTQPPTRDGNKSFYDIAPSPHANSHQRNASATPSSPVLPIGGQRQSASTRNTRSLDGNEEALRYSDSPQTQPLPVAPSFRQFLSNRPAISQRPGVGSAAAGGMASRFSWTNSNAPQTPHNRLMGKPTIHARRRAKTQATIPHDTVNYLLRRRGPRDAADPRSAQERFGYHQTTEYRRAGAQR
jgi:hypothetical protein